MRDDIAGGIKYVLSCIPPPMEDRVKVDWRYVPASTLGGDAIGYHWVDADHLALYLIDVTGHGIDSALLSVTITNVIRSGSLAGADMRQPPSLAGAGLAQRRLPGLPAWLQVLYALGNTGSIKPPATPTLTYASGRGHPAAILVVPWR